MFERFRKGVKNWMQRTGADIGIAKEFKDISTDIVMPSLWVKE